jgi:PAS domain S-box-containing protein
MVPPDNIADLLARLAEAEEALAALRGGNADALILARDVIGLPGSEKPYQTFFEAMNEGGLTLDAEGRILHCNPRFSAMLGRPVEALRGQLFLNQIAERDRTTVSDCISRDEIATCEATLAAQDQTRIPILLSLRPMTLGNQRFNCLVVTDLSERVEAESRLRAQFAFNELLIDTAQVIILVLDTEGRIQRINRYLETISGYAAD